MTATHEDLHVTGAWPPSLVERSAARVTATVDVLARTALATAMTGASIPPLLRPGAAAEEVEHLAFYRDLAARGDARSTFVDPPEVEVRARRLSPPPWARGIGLLESLTFESPFRPRNPAIEAHHAPDHPNRIARAQHWRHPDGPRPTIVVLHGFAASPALFNSTFFSLPWFYGNGCDVLLVTLPFHGRRARLRPALDGTGLFAGGLVRLNEALLQAVSDIRSLVGHLLASGVPRVGVTGLSLGGYLSATLAAAEPRLAFSIPNAPAVELGRLIRAWFPAGTLLGAALRLRGRTFDDLSGAMAVHSPLAYEPAIDRERRFVIGGLGDRFTPPEQAEMLWEHWGRCRMHWYPGNHVLHLQRDQYLREVGRFLRTIGFSEGRAAP
jgi:pimeloyl-ACP methyl ester carboxylesterase